MIPITGGPLHSISGSQKPLQGFLTHVGQLKQILKGTRWTSDCVIECEIVLKIGLNLTLKLLRKMLRIVVLFEGLSPGGGNM